MNCRMVHSRPKKRVAAEEREKTVEAARVESDSRNESGAKDRVDSPEQVAGDLERQGEEWPGRGGVPPLALTVGSWRSGECRGACRVVQPDFRLHASSAYFKSPHGYTASIHYPDLAVSLVRSLRTPEPPPAFSRFLLIRELG